MMIGNVDPTKEFHRLVHRDKNWNFVIDESMNFKCRPIAHTGIAISGNIQSSNRLASHPLGCQVLRIISVPPNRYYRWTQLCGVLYHENWNRQSATWEKNVFRRRFVGWNHLGRCTLVRAPSIGSYRCKTELFSITYNEDDALAKTTQLVAIDIFNSHVSLTGL